MGKDKKLKIKSLCKLSKKDVSANIKEIISLTDTPSFICTKCARVANSKSLLCEAISF
jgi:hypothetical protein